MKPGDLAMWTERPDLVHLCFPLADGDGDVLAVRTLCGQVAAPEDAEDYEPTAVTCRRCRRTRASLMFA